MSFDPKVYRNTKDGVGSPADTAATDSTSAWTSVSLLKGLYATLTGAGITVTGVSTAARQDTGNATLTAIDGHVDGLETLVTSSNTKLDTLHTDIAATEVLVGAVGETAPASDTASSGLNGRLQRIAQRITSLIALVPAALSGSGNFKVAVNEAIAAGEAHVGQIGATTVVISASSTITRPADTTAYTSGDLVANSVTAGSVAALQFTTAARVSGGSGAIVGARIQKSTTSVTNAAFRLHLFDTTPTFTSAGDNSAISTVVVASAKGYLGYVDITTMIQFSDVAWGTGAPDNNRGSVPFKATAQIIFGILEARGTYTPGNAEVFTIAIMILQD